RLRSCRRTREQEGERVATAQCSPFRPVSCTSHIKLHVGSSFTARLALSGVQRERTSALFEMDGAVCRPLSDNWRKAFSELGVSDPPHGPWGQCRPAARGRSRPLVSIRVFDEESVCVSCLLIRGICAHFAVPFLPAGPLCSAA